MRCLILGDGRAGGSFARALESVGWTTSVSSSRTIPDLPSSAFSDRELVLLAVPDSAIEQVSRQVAARAASFSGVVAHVSGVCGLDVLAGHRRIGSVHPLMSLPDPDIGSRRLLDGCWFAVAGDPLMTDVVDQLGGHRAHVPDDRRGLYHATATVAANHLVALCAHVESLAAEAGVPAEAYWNLATTTLENVVAGGSTGALTGPVARGDWDTIRSHLRAIPVAEREVYLALARRAATMAGRTIPADIDGSN